MNSEHDSERRSADLQQTTDFGEEDALDLQIGPYKLLQEIGHGGMGVVYMAEQTEPVKRRVALKIIKPGMDSREVIARFEAERQALALMEHPNIARVLDAGTTHEGRPFFVMELVNGVPITEYCDERNLPTKERLQLFADVCRGVQHAHHKGIIHRDLKPSNVLIAEYDDERVPKVIDFGVAKATNQSLTDKTLFTQFGQVVGTLEYMSPEQAKRNQLDVDTRSDVYSLGIVLYELLTGETPIERQRLKELALDEMLRIIREEDPPRPSVKLSSSRHLADIAAKRSIDPTRLPGFVRGELDWIVLRTLAKDRGQRYSTAQELCDDIHRYLSDQPILAGPPNVGVRLKKLIKRNKSIVGIGAAAVATLLVATLWMLANWSIQARQIADRSNRASAVIDEATMTLGQAVNSPIGTRTEWLKAALAYHRADKILREGQVNSAVSERFAALDKRYSTARQIRDIAERTEQVLITSATHFDLESWQRMEQDMREIFSNHGFDLKNGNPQDIGKRIHEHQFASRFSDLLELWIATKAQIGMFGGPKATRATMQPWANALYVADRDPLRTGIRKLFYKRRPFGRAQVDELVKGVDLSKVGPRTLTWLFTIYDLAKAHDATDKIAKNALRWYPTNVMLNFEYGFVLAHRKRWQEAIRMYSRALALRPDAAGIWRVMGQAMVQVKELSNAEQAFERSIELEDNYGPTWIDLAELHVQQKDYEQALTVGYRIQKLMPQDFRGYGIIGRSLMGQKKFTAAEESLKECIKLARGNRTSLALATKWLKACQEGQQKK